MTALRLAGVVVFGYARVYSIILSSLDRGVWDWCLDIGISLVISWVFGVDMDWRTGTAWDIPACFDRRTIIPSGIQTC